MSGICTCGTPFVFVLVKIVQRKWMPMKLAKNMLFIADRNGGIHLSEALLLKPQLIPQIQILLLRLPSPINKILCHSIKTNGVRLAFAVYADVL